MAVLYVGSKGSTWTAADWVSRNVLIFLRPALIGAGLESVAVRLAGPADAPPPYADLSDLLDSPRATALWERALAAALAAIDAEAGSGWLEPQRAGTFRAAAARLADLGTADGNALVVGLAERISKNFDPTP